MLRVGERTAIQAGEMTFTKLTLTATTALIALVATALLIGPAGAAEAPTRADYVRVAEPICKRNTVANQRLLKGVRGKIRRNRLKPAGRQFARAARAFGAAVRKIARLPRPTEDVAALSRWIKLLNKQAIYLRGISKSLLAGNRFKSQRLSVLLVRNATQANNAVLRFGFRQCRVRPGLVT